MRHCSNRHLIAGNADVCPWCGLDTEPGPPYGMTEAQGQALLSETFRRNQRVAARPDVVKLAFGIVLGLIAFCALVLLGSLISMRRWELARSACLAPQARRKGRE